MENGIVPAALRKKDTVAFISPSARLNSIYPGALERAKTKLEALGYKIKIIFDETITFHFRREAALKRCEEVHAAFRDPEVKAIICTIGGSYANELLPHLDYGLIKANPKIFVGYSDITVLHYAIFTQTGLRTFYGPAVITELGEFPNPFPFTMNHLLRVIAPDQIGTPVGPIPRSPDCNWDFPKFMQDPSYAGARTLEPSPGWKWLRGGKATGRIFGGCLTSVLHLPSTKYWPDMEGKVLLLETALNDSGTGPFPTGRSRALMADLVNMGVIGKISGLVLGRAFAHDEKMREEFEEVVLDQCFGTEFPILANVDVGHTTPLVTIPLNALVSLDSEKDDFTVLEAGVR
jgi:muramoyltetrapeptide carboxypeptidase LdcA involved in peptidoglycan recycling